MKISEMLSQVSQNQEGVNILVQIGLVEFFVNFNKFLESKLMKEVVYKNEQIIKTIINTKSHELHYKPIKEQLQNKEKDQCEFKTSEFQNLIFQS